MGWRELVYARLRWRREWLAQQSDSYLNHFTQPDSIIPDQGNSQSWDRYTYARNNPVNRIDPTGHADCSAISYEAARKACEATRYSFPPEDDSWGAGADHKDRNWLVVKSLLENYHGPKWWSGSLPDPQEWTAFLMGKEGGVLKYDSDKLTLTQIILYKILNYKNEPGTEFTPVTNPIISPVHELNNFTQADWNALINPDKNQLQKGFELVNQIADSITKPKYLYFVDETEMNAANVKVSDFTEGGYHIAPAYPGSSGNNFMVFLQYAEDFRKVFP